ncbi:DUF6192 family protein [Nonomuraea sp. NPDC050451]|uniref:DUF6192 family protein n=1 Tax=Nonomuraea sp. NPDC050451 TaxID=3364364 RepID=UPI003792D4ED
MTTMIGKVTQERYEQLVADGLEQLAVQGRTQLQLGDHALEIEPMNPRGGSHAGLGEESFGVRQSLAQYAEDLDMPLTTLLDNRWVASRWPKERRQHGVSYVVHKALAGIAEEDVRFAKILDPPWHEKSKTHRWTQDAAKREVGQRVNRPTTVQEKVNKVHDLLEDEKVAAQVATDLLRQPQVVSEVVEDQTAMHLVNRAQVDRSHRIAQQRMEAVPQPAKQAIQRAREQVRHNREYVDLVGACATFVAAAGRIVPTLRGHAFTEEERERVHANLARVRGATEWIGQAIDTGDLSLDEGLAALLRGE